MSKAKPRMLKREMGTEKLFRNIIRSMLTKRRSPLMLVGDPGTGKTSFVRNFAKVCGLGLMVIEAPHIIPEKLITIPYYVYKPGSSKQKPDWNKAQETEITDQEDIGKWVIKRAIPKIITDIKKLHQHAKQLNWTKEKALKIAKTINPKFVKLVETRWPQIEAVREKVSVILFLDEALRTVDPKVGNALRDIYINRIAGGQNLPNYVYVLLASNVGDIGTDEISEHFTMEFVDYAVSPEEIEGFLTNQGVDKTVIKKAMQALVTKDGKVLAGEDPKTGLYFSQRKFTNMVRLIDAALKGSLKEKQAVATILAYSGKALEDIYDDNAPKHPLAERLQEEFGQMLGQPVSLDKWNRVIPEYLKLVHKLKNYDHVLNLASLPGVGKTTFIRELAKSLGARCVTLSVPNIQPEATVGVINVDETSATVSFDSPELFHIIKQVLGFTDDDFKEENITPGKPRFIVFLDEINRVQDPKILNSLRLLMKEKQVNEDPSTKLPPDTIVITAMNPSDIPDSVVEMSKHTTDIMDVVPCMPLATTKKYIEQSVDAEYPDVGEKAVDILWRLLEMTSPGVGADGKKVPKEFRVYWQGTEADSKWFPPRNIEEVFSKVVVALKLISDMYDVSEMDDKELQEVIREELADDVPDYITGRLYRTKDESETRAFVNQLIKDRFNQIVPELAKLLKTRYATADVTFFQVIGDDYSVKQGYLAPMLESDKPDYVFQQWIDYIETLLKANNWPDLASILNKLAGNLEDAVKDLAKEDTEWSVPPMDFFEKAMISLDMQVANKYYTLACDTNVGKGKPAQLYTQAYKFRQNLEKQAPRYAAIITKIRSSGDTYINKMRTQAISAAMEGKVYNNVCTLNPAYLLGLLVDSKFYNTLLKLVEVGVFGTNET